MKSGIHWRIGTNFFREGSRQKLKVNDPHPVSPLFSLPSARIETYFVCLSCACACVCVIDCQYPVYKDKDMNVDMNMHWNAEFSLPNMEGGISRSGGEMDIFPGYCHLDVPEVSAKIRFGKPKFQKKKV